MNQSKVQIIIAVTMPLPTYFDVNKYHQISASARLSGFTAALREKQWSGPNKTTNVCERTAIETRYNRDSKSTPEDVYKNKRFS